MTTAASVGQLADTARTAVSGFSGPIVALGVALLVLTITVAVIAFITSRVPKD